MSTVNEFIRAKATLGEGPVWYQDRLWWVDIHAQRLHSSADGEQVEAIDIGQKIGAAVPTDKDGVWLVARQDGVYSLDTASHEQQLLVDPEADDQHNRLNDGKCDPWGNFLIGSMRSGSEEPCGALYRIHSVGEVERLLSGVGISNGLAWSQDGSVMYFIDTTTGRIDRYGYGPEQPLGERETVLQVPEAMGHPDGMSIDTDGNLWVALWGGSCVICVDATTGEILEQIPIPALHVTSCAFGGEGLSSLFVTTASDEPQVVGSAKGGSGSIYRLECGAVGLPVVCYRGGL